MDINQKMVDEFNYILKVMNCSFKLTLNEQMPNPTCYIEPNSMAFVDSFTVNMNEAFFNALENHFADKGVQVEYNNTKSCFWSKTPYVHH